MNALIKQAFDVKHAVASTQGYSAAAATREAAVQAASVAAAGLGYLVGGFLAFVKGVVAK